MKYWSGDKITSLTNNQIFVYGANPEFRNGAGAAKHTRNFGALPYGGGRGIVGQTYGLITKNLKACYVEEATGIKYTVAGERSVPLDMIKDNVKELYTCAKDNPEKEFLIAYTFGGENLNGYTTDELLPVFLEHENIPDNVIFHDSIKPYKEKLHKTFKVVIAGGRDFTDLNLMSKHMDKLLANKKDCDIVVISGTARGADKTGELYAKYNNYVIDEYPADWDKHGKSAGYIRNSEMADNVDAVVVFWDGVSRGSKHMIDITKKKGLPLRVVKY